MRKRTLTSPDQIVAAIEELQRQRAADGLPMTKEAICVCIGIDSDKLDDYIKCQYGVSPEVSAVIKKAVDQCKLSMTDYGYKAKNPMFSMFMLNSTMGYQDAHKVTVDAPTFAGEDGIKD